MRGRTEREKIRKALKKKEKAKKAFENGKKKNFVHCKNARNKKVQKQIGSMIQTKIQKA